MYENVTTITQYTYILFDIPLSRLAPTHITRVISVRNSLINLGPHLFKLLTFALSDCSCSNMVLIQIFSYLFLVKIAFSYQLLYTF